MNKEDLLKEYYESFTQSALVEIAVSKKIGDSAEIMNTSKEDLVDRLMKNDLGVKPVEIAKVPAPTAPSAAAGDFGTAIASLVAQHLNPQVQDEKVEAILKPYIEKLEQKFNTIAKEIKKGIVNKVEIIKSDKPSITMDDTHMSFHKLVEIAGQRIPVFLSGPAGSFKTTAAWQLSKALELNYYPISVGAQTTKTDLMGYMDANGNYNESPVYKSYTTGGVLLLDEIDAGNANTLTMLNALLSSEVASFPCGTMTKHKDFVIVVAGNTWGYGASREYVGRNQLDGAFLNRFIFLPWDYDEKLETKLSGNLEWASFIQSVRSIVNKLNIRIIISPRASIFGAKLIEAGIDWKETTEMVLWNSVGNDIREKIRTNLPEKWKNMTTKKSITEDEVVDLTDQG